MVVEGSMDAAWWLASSHHPATAELPLNALIGLVLGRMLAVGRVLGVCWAYVGCWACVGC